MTTVVRGFMHPQNKGKKHLKSKQYCRNTHVLGFKLTKKVSAKYLAKKYLDDLRDNLNWELPAWQKKSKKECNSNVSRQKLYRAKRRAKSTIARDVKGQYLRLHDYAETVIKLNPGTIFKFSTERLTEDPKSLPIFKRLYVRFDACKRGFLAGCRPIIGLDGCFLKGPYGGQLLSAIGRDENDNIFSIALAIVEIESRDSWEWFLTELLDNIGENEIRKYVFISDRPKGLVECFRKLLLNNEHRFCLKHLYNNFKLHYKGKELRDLFWLVASSGDVYGFNSVMKELQKTKPSGKPTAAKWLQDIGSETWIRSHFTNHYRCDVLVNNLNKHDGPIGPKIQKKLEVNKIKSRSCSPLYDGTGKYKVTYEERTFIVNLVTKTCGCRMWDLSEIPCKHVVCAIWAHREQPEQYVLLCYSRDFYLTTYSFIIHLVPTHHEWVISELKKIQPPHYHKPTGRPRKQRRKAIDEPKNPHKSSRKNLTVTCARCLTTGHNSRACKLPPHPDSKLFKSIGGFDGAGTSHGVGSSHGSAKLKAKIGSKSKQLRKSNAGKKTTKSQVSSQLTGGTLLGKRPICSSSPPFSNRGNFQSRWNPVGEAEMWTASKPSLSSQPPSNANKKTSSQPGSSSQPPPTGSKKKAASSNKSPTKGCLGLTRRGGKGIRGGN